MANKKLSAIIQIGGAVSSSLGAAFGSVTRSTSQLGQAVANLTRQQRMLGDAIQTFGRQGKSVDGLRERYAAVTRELERQRSHLQRINSLEAARKANLDHRAQLRGKIGDTVAMGAAVLLPAGAALNKSAEFNYQLQAIGNTADMTKPQIAALGRQILQISDETGKSAQTVQQAMGFLVAAGMDVGTAANVLRPVGRTATATASEIEDVAKATFTLNDALKIQPTQMQRALDMLVQAGKEGNFEFKDMAAELPVLAAGMQSLKMTGTEAVATLGAALQIARKGAGTSGEAATNVQNFLAKLMSPETLKKAQKNFGVDLYKIISEAQKKGQNPFEAAILAINKMTKGGDQKLLGDLFQDMQVQNFLRPMLQNLQEFDRIKRAALSADGVTDRDFGKMMETTKVQMDEATNAVGRLGLAIGNSLEPAVGRLLAVLTPVVRSVADFVTANSELVGNTTVVVGALLSARLTVLAGGFAFTFLKGAVLSVGSALLFVGRALLLNPIGLAVTAIAGAVFLIYKYWEPLKGWFSALWDDIKATFAGVYDWIVGKVAYLMELPGRIKDKVASVFSGGGDAGQMQYDAMGNATGMALPEVPAPAKRGGTTVNDHSQTTFNITQQPGQDSKALAAEIEKELRKRQGVRSRSMMFDGVGAQ